MKSVSQFCPYKESLVIKSFLKFPFSFTAVVKCEFMNPGGSIKDRIGKRMVDEGERMGIYKHGDTLIEPTSGNTGTYKATSFRWASF